eukprot:m.86248 g.86248  ORF g.86248 m.86248 type:complete len:301 (-) comp11449_c0_seq1:1458-2360(-)
MNRRMMMILFCWAAQRLSVFSGLLIRLSIIPSHCCIRPNISLWNSDPPKCKQWRVRQQRKVETSAGVRRCKPGVGQRHVVLAHVESMRVGPCGIVVRFLERERPARVDCPSVLLFPRCWTCGVDHRVDSVHVAKRGRRVRWRAGGLHPPPIARTQFRVPFSPDLPSVRHAVKLLENALDAVGRPWSPGVRPRLPHCNPNLHKQVVPKEKIGTFVGKKAVHHFVENVAGDVDSAFVVVDVDGLADARGGGVARRRSWAVRIEVVEQVVSDHRAAGGEVSSGVDSSRVEGNAHNVMKLVEFN